LVFFPLDLFLLEFCFSNFPPAIALFDVFGIKFGLVLFSVLSFFSFEFETTASDEELLFELLSRRFLPALFFSEEFVTTASVDELVFELLSRSFSTDIGLVFVVFC
jgi:hypothetical protein